MEYLLLHEGYAVTIIVDGGVGSLEVIENDIKNGRPIVLIQVFLLFNEKKCNDWILF